MKKQKVEWKIVVAAIIGLVILECVALMNGINGTMFTMVVAIIAALAGFVLPSPVKFN